MMRSLLSAESFWMERAPRVHCTPQFCIFLAAMLFLVPLPWIIGWFTAVAIHEAFHCIALWVCGKKIYEIYVELDGAKILSEDLNWSETVFCALAGPIGGLMLGLTIDDFPQLALCGLLQSVYNLLPVLPLDGGRALQGIMHLLLREELAERLCICVEILTCLSVFTAGIICLWVWHLGFFPLILAVILVIKLKNKKPCK